MTDVYYYVMAKDSSLILTFSLPEIGELLMRPPRASIRQCEYFYYIGAKSQKLIQPYLPPWMFKNQMYLSSDSP